MARRATFINDHIDSTDFAMFIDAGGFARGGGDIGKLYTNYLLRGMADLGYTVFNLSYRDFITGGNILKDLSNKHNVEFIASNTFYKDNGKPFTEPYLVKTIKPHSSGKSLPVDKIRVGIVGMCDEYGLLFSKQIKEPMLEAKPPLDFAEKLIAQVRKKADIVVLLYNGNYAKLKPILETVKGIDVTIMGGQYYMVTPNDHFESIIVSTPSMGKYGGLLTLQLDNKKKIVSHRNENIPLKEDMQDDPAMLKLIKEFEEAEKKLQDETIYSSSSH
ncbi:MAG TPA: hypothetical protein PLP19_07655 [bacterium]|nr:hypothetical protein [bacterium]HPN43347.1 hypothetical protein [bacterium]